MKAAVMKQQAEAIELAPSGACQVAMQVVEPDALTELGEHAHDGHLCTIR